MKAWYWGPNFGDMLTPWILDQMDVPIEWTEPSQAELFGVGSIMHRIPSRFTGFVWGTGVMFPGNPHLGCDHDLDLSQAQVLALRGKDTAQVLGMDDVLLGDTGLLVKEVYQKKPQPAHKYGIIPHFDDHHLAALHPDACIIDPMAGPDIVVPAIANCGSIITSSLHALVVADALGLPSMWAPYNQTPEHARKFHDYHSIYSTELEPMVWRMAPQKEVRKKVEELAETVEVFK